MVIKEDQPQWFTSFFDKNSSGSGAAATESNYQLANEFHRQIIRKFKKRKVYSLFREYLEC